MFSDKIFTSYYLDLMANEFQLKDVYLMGNVNLCP